MRSHLTGLAASVAVPSQALSRLFALLVTAHFARRLLGSRCALGPHHSPSESVLNCATASNRRFGRKRCPSDLLTGRSGTAYSRRPLKTVLASAADWLNSARVASARCRVKTTRG